MTYLLRTTLLASFALAVLDVVAFAQDPIGVRGTIERIEESKLFLKTRYGAPVKLIAGESPELIAVVKSSIAEIRPGMLVGSAGKLRPDEIQRVTEVLIFPDFLQSASESHNRLDQTSESGAAKGNVEQITTESDGHTLIVKFKQGEKKLLVSDSAPVITFVHGDRSDLKPGVAVSVVDAKRLPQGLLQADIIIYGRDGLTPP